MPCTRKHTKYQPTDEEFKCPKCGAGMGDFCIDTDLDVVSTDPDCPDLHVDDQLVCWGKNGKGCPAQYGTSGKAFAATLVKKHNLEPCKHCKGNGLVKKGNQ